MTTISLNGIWNLRGRSERNPDSEALSLKAEVPGCVQLDLSREGYLPADLYMGENIREAEKFEGHEWWYETSFECPRVKNNVYLVFEGVDCLADYDLNGEWIGESENALNHHEFRVDGYLQDGENTLTVHIRSAMNYAREQDYPIRSLLSINPDGSYLRKPPHSFGWDIMYEIPKDDNIGKVTITREYIEGTGGPVIDIRSNLIKGTTEGLKEITTDK